MIAAFAAAMLAARAVVAEEGGSGAITVFQPAAAPADPGPAVADAPDTRDALQRDAEALLERILAGDASVLERATPELRATLDATRLRAIVAGLRGQAGAPRGLLANRHDSRGGMEIITLTTAFERANIDARLVFDADGRLAGLSIRPADTVAAYKPADYALPVRFVDREVRVGVPGWLLPATLTLPEGEGPFPALVLVHGAGPQDRDATLGPNRIFRDLAEGLANRGIAVLRYDKRTLAHEARVGGVAGFDIDSEVVDDAAAAVAWLRAQRGIDGRRVFVLGHGFGGMVVPRIARAAPELAGVVVLAGAVKPLEESIIAQTSYLAGYDGRIDDEERVRMSELLALRARVRELQPGDPPVVVAGSSAPASWWHSLRGIDAPAEAARLPVPVLALQGERDFQVTMEDFGAWQRALAAQPRSRAVAYPALNHLFIAGTGRSHPNEYALVGHVAVEVIDDIARWIAETPPATASTP
jgi:dienelactone hydrolase